MIHPLIRKLQCCKSTPNVRGPQGPQRPQGDPGTQGESGIGILNMLYFKNISVILTNGSATIVDLSYNSDLTESAGLNGFFTENDNEDTNIIFNKLTSPTIYGIEIYAHCDLSGSKSGDTIILDLSGTIIETGFNNKILIDARSVNLKINNGITTSVSFGPVMYRITNSSVNSSERVIHSNNEYRFRATLLGTNNETITLSNIQLVIKAIKTGI